MTLHGRVAQIAGSRVTGSRTLNGDLGGATLLTLEDGRKLVAKQGPLVQREGAMLEAMAAASAPVPRRIHVGPDLLLMDFIPAHGAADFAQLAETLNALLGAPSQARYGWHENYAFGDVFIANTPTQDWPQFWRDHRLLCHADTLEPGLMKRLEVLAKRLPDMVPKSPAPCLLHGDLWQGNIVWASSGPVLIDPACYVGHREVDIAMLTVFDHPPAGFFEALSLEPGWRERLPIYRLWPLLVHLRLFGQTYHARVLNTLEQCRV